jgi:hypothetical protein
MDEQHIAVFGGLDTKLRHHLQHTGLRCYGGARHSGNGELRRLLAALRSGTISEVLILWRWLGHSEVETIIATCNACGVAYTRMSSMSKIRRHLPKL